MESEPTATVVRAHRFRAPAVALAGLLMIASGFVYDWFSTNAIMNSSEMNPEFDLPPTPAWVGALSWFEYLIPLGVLVMCLALVIRQRQLPTNSPDTAGARFISSPWAVLGIVALALATLFLWPDHMGPGGMTVALAVASLVPVFTFVSRPRRISWLLAALLIGFIGIAADISANGGGGMASLVFAPFVLGAWFLQVAFLLIGLVRGAFSGVSRRLPG